MHDATYTHFSSMGPHPCLWHQTREQAQMGRNGKLGCLSERIFQFTPTCHVEPNLPAWLIRRRCFVYVSMQSKRRQIYMLNWLDCTSCWRRIQIIMQISDCKMSQIDLEMTSRMTHSNISQWSLSEAQLGFTSPNQHQQFQSHTRWYSYSLQEDQYQLE